MEEKKFYYVAFMEFIKTNIITTNKQPQTIVNYNYVVTKNHPFKWLGLHLKNKDPKAYNVQMTWWKELTEDEYELFIITKTGLDSPERQN